MAKTRRLHEGLNIVTADQVRPRGVEWDWRHWLPRGFVGLLGGHPGIGKSQILVDLAARISRGNAMPDDSAGPEPGMVMLLSGEDSKEHTVIPRLLAAGAEMQNVIVEAQVGVPVLDDEGDENGVQAEPFNFDAHRDFLEEAMGAYPIRLLILDPLTLFLGESDRRSYSGVYSAMSPLIEFAARHEVSIIGNTHLNKGKDMTAMQRIMDSTGLVAAPRFLWMAAQDKDGYSMLWVAKSNLGPPPPGLHFEIEPFVVGATRHKRSKSKPRKHGETEFDFSEECIETSRIKWLGSADRKGSEIIESEGKPKSQRQEAKEYLLKVLKEGPVLADEVIAGAPVSERTLRTAKKELQIQSKKAGKEKFYWQLPQ